MKNKGFLQANPMVVAAAIIRHEEKFLITKRKPDSHFGNFWEFPGGKAEPGETLSECLRREIREELGVEISAPRYFHTIRFPYPEKDVELHFFTCSIEKGEPRALGGVDLSWVDKQDLVSYQFPPANIPVLNKILRTDFLKESVW